jgi:predicted nucleotide-binding protein
MDKSRLFIASSGRTLLLAEKLRNALQTDNCEVLFWTYKDRSQPGMTIIEMLKDVAEQSDFGVIILVKDDVLARETGGTLETRNDFVLNS